MNIRLDRVNVDFGPWEPPREKRTEVDLMREADELAEKRSRDPEWVAEVWAHGGNLSGRLSHMVAEASRIGRCNASERLLREIGFQFVVEVESALAAQAWDQVASEEVARCF